MIDHEKSLSKKKDRLPPPHLINLKKPRAVLVLIRKPDRSAQGRCKVKQQRQESEHDNRFKIQKRDC